MKKVDITPNIKQFTFVNQNFDSAEKIATARIQRFGMGLKVFLRNRAAAAGAIIFILIILGVIIFPLIFTDVSYHMSNQHLPLFSPHHFFGTDSYGRDMWSALWVGIRYSVGISLVTAAITLVVGVTIGLLMGYSRRMDLVLQFISKILSNIPVIILLIVFGLIFQPSFWSIILGLSVTGWIDISMQVRSQVLKFKKLDFFVASKILATPWYKKLLNLLPLTMPIIIASIALTIPSAILGEAALGFIGLSIPAQPTIGNMIYSSYTLLLVYPREILIPVVFLIVITVSVQLIGNGVEDVTRRGVL